MKTSSTFHGASGSGSFLGLRKNARGAVEIVYDDGVTRRMVWRVNPTTVNEQRIGEALRIAVDQVRVLPALYSELKKRAITIEAVVN